MSAATIARLLNRANARSAQINDQAPVPRDEGAAPPTPTPNSGQRTPLSDRVAPCEPAQQSFDTPPASDPSPEENDANDANDANEDHDQQADSVLPPACCRCNEKCREVLLRCAVCNDYFCRSAPRGSSTSHWTYHRRVSQHRRAVVLLPDGEWTLLCSHCKSEDILGNLGFFTPLVHDEKGHVRLCCRDCAAEPKVASLYGGKTWSSLLDRDSDELQPSILGGAPEHACPQTDRHEPTQAQLAALEFAAEREVTQRDVANRISATTLPPIPSRFSTAADLEKAFLPVLEAEADCQREQEATKRITGCPGTILTSGVQYLVELTMVTAGSLTKLSEVILQFETEMLPGNWPLLWEGYVTSIKLAIPTGFADTCYKCMVVVTGTKSGFPQHLHGHSFAVYNKYGSVTFERMKAVMKRLSDEAAPTKFHNGAGAYRPNAEPMMNKDLLKALLTGATMKESSDVGKPLNKLVEILPNSYKKLNPSQKEAVKHTLTHPLTLIQGPPGTGKTSTCAVIVSLFQALYKNTKMLVCAGSNTAVDHLASQLIKAQATDGMPHVKILRVEAYSIQGNCNPDVQPHSLYAKVNAIIKSRPMQDRLRMLHKRREDGDSKWDTVKDEYERLRREVEYTVLSKADVVLCTCATAGNRLFQGTHMTFENVLLDEACQTLEPESLIPLQHGAKRVVLVGDHRQLEPMVSLPKAGAAGLGRSLFERLLGNGMHALMLETQYRMHPAIAAFPSAEFYEGRLKNGVPAKKHTHKREPFSWPNPAVPMVFIHVDKTEDEPGPLKLSFRNTGEAVVVVSVVQQLLTAGITAESIGVISPYKAQCEYISSRIARNPKMGLSVANAIEVSTVDKFQGREKNYIIHSCVRCNRDKNIGFMYNPRRLNVSITRARCGLIFVGDLRTLWHATAKSPDQRSKAATVWRPLIRHYHEKNMIVRPRGDLYVPYSPEFLDEAE